MIDTLWALGRRFRWEGITTPFEHVRQSIDYVDLAAAEKAIQEVGEEIAVRGVPAAVSPVVFGVAGYGHVSKGAQEILDLLPVETLSSDTLTSSASGLGSGIDSRRVGKVVFAEEHMAEPAAPGASFQLQEYYQYPERYRARFEEFLPHLTVLVNGIYWESRYPRLVTKDYLRRSYAAGGSPKLRVIGDISCDLGGAIEATMKTTVPDSPVYLYDPSSDRLTDGWEGHGPVILAVDFLPAELPVDASQSFGDVLTPFVPALARADYAVDFEALDLPPELKRAVIVHRGKLTPEYRYIESFLRS
jgi:alpha-aminoadipic semialdehyde synthase